MKKGFTLVEILASILIMGVIGGMILLNISDVLDKSTYKTKNETVKGIIRSIEIYNAEEYALSNGECINIKKIDTENEDVIKGGEFCISNEEIFLKEVKIENELVSGNPDEFYFYKQNEKHIVTFELSNVPNLYFLIDNNTQLLDYIDNFKLEKNGKILYSMWPDMKNILLDIDPIIITSNITINEDYKYE